LSDFRTSTAPITEVQIDETLANFTAVMRYKMVKNLFKGHWRDDAFDIPYLLRRLDDEVAELRAETARMGILVDAVDAVDDIVRECADVANFAMMLADFVKFRAQTG
jgi:hypothetical protein